MKIRQFIKEHILFAVISVVIFVVYRKIIGAFATLLLLAFLLIYSGTMTLCWFAMSRLEQLEKNGRVSQKTLLGLSFLIASPIYLIWLIISLIPILSWEVWLITGLPITVIAVFSLFSIAEHWQKTQRFIFWMVQVVVYLCLLCAGQSVVSLLPF